MTRDAHIPARRARRAAALALLGAAAFTIAGCGNGERKAEDQRISKLGQEVAQLSQQVRAQDQRISQLGMADRSVPLAVSTQTGPDNTVVAQCPPGAFLFRVPRTPAEGGEALCRPIAAPAGVEIKGH